MIYEPFHAN